MDRVKYHCKHCKYEFTRKAGFKFVRCPYCGKEGGVEEKKGDYASKLLDDI